MEVGHVSGGCKGPHHIFQSFDYADVWQPVVAVPIQHWDRVDIARNVGFLYLR